MIDILPAPQLGQAAPGAAAASPVKSAAVVGGVNMAVVDSRHTILVLTEPA